MQVQSLTLDVQRITLEELDVQIENLKRIRTYKAACSQLELERQQQQQQNQHEQQELEAREQGARERFEQARAELEALVQARMEMTQRHTTEEQQLAERDRALQCEMQELEKVVPFLSQRDGGEQQAGPSSS